MRRAGSCHFRRYRYAAQRHSRRFTGVHRRWWKPPQHSRCRPGQACDTRADPGPISAGLSVWEGWS